MAETKPPSKLSKAHFRNAVRVYCTIRIERDLCCVIDTEKVKSHLVAKLWLDLINQHLQEPHSVAALIHGSQDEGLLTRGGMSSMAETLAGTFHDTANGNGLGAAIVDELGRPLMTTTSPAVHGISPSGGLGLAELSSTRDAVAAAAALHAIDPLDAVLQSAQQIAASLTGQLSKANEAFNDL
jgi:hypothetical protein